jgi:bifunctional enzyme CysN/CysC
MSVPPVSSIASDECLSTHRVSSTFDGSVPEAECLSVVITGHVDHGKSTVIGRLLADAGGLPEGKLNQLRSECERNAKPFEYAFLLDALRDEQAQGITIDAARVFFTTARRRYMIIDAPGHVEFLKNMITGASRAEAALLVIDAKEGIKENSRRHGYLLSVLGISQILVLVNKMDLVAYERAPFEETVAEYASFLDQIGVHAAQFIPVAAQPGDNIARRSDRLPWYAGPTVLEALDRLRSEPPPTSTPLRMPVQDVYKFTERHDTRRIVAGTIETGRLRIGDEVVFYPSGKKSHVRTIEAFNRPSPLEATAGEATGFTLTEELFVTRGEIATRADEPPPAVTTRIRVTLFWLGRQPLVPNKPYIVKLGTAKVQARVDIIHRVLDASTLSVTLDRDRVERHEVCECSLVLSRPLAFDTVATNKATSRFVIVDDYEICGGGIVQEALPDRQAYVREKVLQRNLLWDPSHVSDERRAERYGQCPLLLIVTGEEHADRKGVARELEARLFDRGRFVYFLGMGNVVHGVDSDIAGSSGSRGEHLRRLGEIANILLDAGLIVVAAAASLTAEEVETIRTTVGQQRVVTAWLGDHVSTDLRPDLLLPNTTTDHHISRLKEHLQDRGAMFSGSMHAQSTRPVTGADDVA